MHSGKMKVTQLDPKWLALVSMWFLSIMESSLTQVASRKKEQLKSTTVEV